MDANNAAQSPHSPYLDARREWNERYGSYLKRERLWMSVTILSLLIAAVATGGVVHIGAQNKFVPYVIEVDKLGNALAVQAANRAQPADRRVIKAMLARFIVNVRSVLVDATAQKRAIFDAYALLRQADPATGLINSFFQSDPPFDRAQTETVTVELETVLPLNQTSWNIEWREIVRDRKGIETSQHRYKAAVTILVIPPTKEETILRNPIGLYIPELSWSKRL